ncbi:hypothetical protein PIB30_041764 [Stylosanthes scabra]|uniref:Uncharacterized protein n=1 Tax=Stylosanthes scabra TaxID=79078 RepID=A0ABU6SF75_9FABA|nr:hypothetical protein [Stylosanthes scabra]
MLTDFHFDLMLLSAFVMTFVSSHRSGYNLARDLHRVFSCADCVLQPGRHAPSLQETRPLPAELPADFFMILAVFEVRGELPADSAGKSGVGNTLPTYRRIFPHFSAGNIILVTNLVSVLQADFLADFYRRKNSASNSPAQTSLTATLKLIKPSTLYGPDVPHLSLVAR